MVYTFERHDGEHYGYQGDHAAEFHKSKQKYLALAMAKEVKGLGKGAVTMPETVPDQWGWYWSGQRQLWVNSNTKAIADILTYRQRPCWSPSLHGRKDLISLDGKAQNQCGLVVDRPGNPVTTKASDKSAEQKKADDEAETEIFLELDSKEKKTLRRICHDYAKLQVGHEGMRSKSHADLLDMLRSDVRICIEEMGKEMNCVIDTWIIQEDKDGEGGCRDGLQGDEEDDGRGDSGGGQGHPDRYESHRQGA